MLTLDDQIFYLEIWSNVPPYFHYYSSIQLEINKEVGNFVGFTKCMTFVTAFVLPTISVKSDDNGHSVNIVCRLARPKES